MTKKAFTAIHILLFFGSTFVYALGKNLNIDLLDIEKGLSHNTVYDMVQDQTGYLWLGTQNGLNRYNGYDILLIAEKQQNDLSKGFKGKCITSLFLDSKDNLWVGTRMGFINIKSAGKNHFDQLTDSSFIRSISAHEISRFYEDSEQNIWIGTVGKGLFKYKPSTGAIKNYTFKKNELSSNEVFDIIEFNGKIIVACSGGNLNILENDNTFSQSHLMKPNSPNLSGYRKKLIEANGYLWLATEGTGLYRIEQKSLDFLNYNSNAEQYGFDANVVRDIVSLNDSMLVLATDGNGLFYLNTNSNKFTAIDENGTGNGHLNSKALTCLTLDKQKNIWIGSYNGGANIIKHSPKVFQIKSLNSSLGFSNVRSVLAVSQFDENRLLVGTDGAGICQYNKLNGSFEPIDFCENGEPKPKVVKSVVPYKNGQFLVACFSQGLYLFNPHNNCFKQIYNNINAWGIKKGPNENYWVCTLGNGLIQLNSDLKMVDQNILPASVSANIMDVGFDINRNIWLGTANEGLYKYDFGIKKLINISQKHPSIGFEIRSIEITTNGKIIVGTEGNGITVFETDGTFFTLDQEKGLLTNNAIAIVNQNDTNIWASSFKGISQINLENKNISNYSLNGIENSNQFNHNALLIQNNLKLFVGGIYGLSIIQLNIANLSKDTFRTLICDIQVQGNSIESLLNHTKATEQIDKLSLKHDRNSFSFSLFSPCLLEASNRVFVFQLIGFDEKPRTTEPGENHIHYANLNAGIYEFKVSYNENITHLPIEIRKPYWQQWWFKALILVFVIAIIASVFGFTISRQKEKHRQELLEFKNEQLNDELVSKNTRLMYSAVQNASKNEVLNELKSQLLVVKSQTNNDGVTKVVRALNRELKNDNYWKTFNTYFNEVDQGFVSNFKQSHGELTQNDQRIIALIRLNLSTNEIASLLNISVRGVEQSKYRLKKKLNLNKTDNLVSYVQNF